MSKSAFLYILVLLAGCTNLETSDFCQIDPERKNEALEKIDAFIQSISTKNVTYTISPLLVQEGKLIRGQRGCYARLFPRSAQPRQRILILILILILDGDGGVYVDLETLKVGPVFWYRY
jgi:hypothetical protein